MIGDSDTRAAAIDLLIHRICAQAQYHDSGAIALVPGLLLEQLALMVGGLYQSDGKESN